MSREEFVFSKKAIVVVSVISVIGSNVVIGFMAALWLWRFSDQVKKETTDAAMVAAVSAVQTTIRPALDWQIAHQAGDNKMEGKINAEIEALKVRQDLLEERVNQVRR